MNISAWIAQALDDIRWCTTAPHAIGHIVKLQAQRNAASRERFTHGMTNDDILSALTSRLDGASGIGGHSDPTAMAALAGFRDDEDETVGSLHHACELIRDSAEEAHHLACQIAKIPPRSFPTPKTLLEILNDAEAHLICLRELASDDSDSHLVWLVREPIAGTALWLRTTAQAIYEGTSVEDRDQPEQKPIAVCRVCAAWRGGTIASRKGMCEQCATFQDHHKCKPTERIVRWWDANGVSADRMRTPPGMILEAKASTRRKGKAS